MEVEETVAAPEPQEPELIETIAAPEPEESEPIAEPEPVIEAVPGSPVVWRTVGGAE